VLNFSSNGAGSTIDLLEMDIDLVKQKPFSEYCKPRQHYFWDRINHEKYFNLQNENIGYGKHT
jgi:hypothetical protein